MRYCSTNGLQIDRLDLLGINMGSNAASAITPAPDRPVECTICSRKFNTIRSLNGHMRVHGPKQGPRGRGRGPARGSGLGRSWGSRELWDEVLERATSPPPTPLSPPPTPLSPPRLHFTDYEQSRHLPPRLPPLAAKDAEDMRKIRKQQGETWNKIIEKVSFIKGNE